MHFRIAVSGSGTGVRAIAISGSPDPRQITMQVGRPFPPAGELAGADPATAKLCDPANLQDLNALYDRFLANGLAEGESVLLGKYLFAVLFGPNWAQIESATPAGPCRGSGPSRRRGASASNGS